MLAKTTYVLHAGIWLSMASARWPTLPRPLRGVAYLAVCLVVYHEKGLQECLPGGG